MKKTEVRGVCWLLRACLAVLFGAAPITSVLACSCGAPAAADVVRATPAIFEGEVVNVHRMTRPGAGYEEVIATIRVTSWWKGNLPARVTVHGHTASSACGYAHFPTGQPLLVLAYPRENASEFGTDACTMLAVFGERRLELGRVLGLLAVERERLEKELDAKPDTLRPLVDLAAFFDRWRDLPAAAEIYGAAARRYPTLQFAHAERGRVLFEDLRYVEAVLSLQRAVELEPADHESARLAGQARLHAGETSVIGGLDFRSLHFRRLDLSGRELRRRDFGRARLEAVNLDGADLSGSRLSHARLDGSARGVRMQGSDLSGATISGDLTAGDLSGANLSGASLLGADLRSVDLSGTRGAWANFGHTITAASLWQNADLALIRLHSADLRNTNFANASLLGADLTGARLCGANLSRANLRGANFVRATFSSETSLPADLDPIRAGMIAVANSDCSR